MSTAIAQSTAMVTMARTEPNVKSPAFIDEPLRLATLHLQTNLSGKP